MSVLKRMLRESGRKPEDALSVAICTPSISRSSKNYLSAMSIRIGDDHKTELVYGCSYKALSKWAGIKPSEHSRYHKVTEKDIECWGHEETGDVSIYLIYRLDWIMPWIWEIFPRDSIFLDIFKYVDWCDSGSPLEEIPTDIKGLVEYINRGEFSSGHSSGYTLQKLRNRFGDLLPSSPNVLEDNTKLIQFIWEHH